METWVTLGILTAIAFGISTVLNKLASSPNYFGIEPRAAGLFVGIGIAATFALYFLLSGGFSMPSNNAGIGTALAAGVFWAVGTLLVLAAFAGGADASKLTPIFNMNTLVVVGLSIVLLHELPQGEQMLRVVGGAILIVLGGILVSI